MGYDTGPGGDHCAQGFRSTASTLLNEEGRSTAMQWKLNSSATRRKKRRRRDKVVRRQLGNGDQKENPRHL